MSPSKMPVEILQEAIRTMARSSSESLPHQEAPWTIEIKKHQTGFCWMERCCKSTLLLIVNQYGVFNIGNGNHVFFWYDHWIGWAIGTTKRDFSRLTRTDTEDMDVNIYSNHLKGASTRKIKIFCMACFQQQNPNNNIGCCRRATPAERTRKRQTTCFSDAASPHVWEKISQKLELTFHPSSIDELWFLGDVICQRALTKGSGTAP